MFKILFRGVLAAVAAKLASNYRYLSIELLKIEAAKSYLHGVRMARLSAIGLVQMGLLLGLICIGVLLFHVGLFVLLPWSLKTKAALGMLLGLIYTIIGCISIRAAMDEKMWMEKSGATKMLAEATLPSQKK